MRWYICFVIIILSAIGVDQSTKFHAQKYFLTWSHSTDVRSFHNSRLRLAHLGVSNAVAHESPARPEVTTNWFDFYFTYTRNLGAAWSTFATMSNRVRQPFFVIVTFIALGMLGFMFRISHVGQRLHRLGLVLMVGGALGNFVDRLTLGYVIDFIHAHWKIFGWEYSFPIFNMADIFINIGVWIILFDFIATEVSLRTLRKTHIPPQ